MTALTCPRCKAQLDLNYAIMLTVAPAPDEPSWRRISLEDLALSIRSRNCLHNLGLDTAGQIDDATDRDLLGSPNLGQRSLREIREQLARVRAGEPLR